MTEHLIKTWDFIEWMEQAQDAAGVEECLLELAHLFGFTSVFGGVVPGPQTALADISSSIFVQRLPSEWKRRYNGRGYVFRDPIVQHDHPSVVRQCRRSLARCLNRRAWYYKEPSAKLLSTAGSILPIWIAHDRLGMKATSATRRRAAFCSWRLYAE